ncbi:MAG: peptidylprolyl isomerase, partial [Roseibacillus sp.]|nr:peptidylprolyl isomerase [Roseibacillus sp.]
VNDGGYNDTIFHRVINGFMIQGGAFTPEMTKKPTESPIKNEWMNGLKNENGTIAMARTQNPNSATNQFFINVKDNPFLNQGHTPDGKSVSDSPGYAVFGKVVEGMEVVDKIKQVDTGVKRLQARGPAGQLVEQPMENVPLQDVVIKKATAGQ